MGAVIDVSLSLQVDSMRHVTPYIPVAATVTIDPPLLPSRQHRKLGCMGREQECLKDRTEPAVKLAALVRRERVKERLAGAILMAGKLNGRYVAVFED